MTTRRSFITGLVSFVAAPAIVRSGSLMPVKVMIEPIEPYGVGPMMSILDDIYWMRAEVDRITGISGLPREPIGAMSSPASASGSDQPRHR